VPEGKKVPLKVKITKLSSASLRNKRKLKLTALIKTSDAAGATTTIKRTYTLRARRR
jgi:hypothetical protein